MQIDKQGILQAGNHDKRRLVNRFGVGMDLAVVTLVNLLPGVAVTYYGEEIGMENTWLSWDETQDPQGCNAGVNGYEKASRDPERTPFQWDNTTSAGELYRTYTPLFACWLRLAMAILQDLATNLGYFKFLVLLFEMNAK